MSIEGIKSLLDDKDVKLSEQEKLALQQQGELIKNFNAKNQVSSRLEDRQLVDKLGNPLTLMEQQVYQQYSLETLRQIIDPKAIAQKQKYNTAENIALLQFYLYLSGAFDKVSEIDGKRGKRTRTACIRAGLLEQRGSVRSHLSLPASSEEKKFATRVIEETPFIQGFAGPEMGYKIDGTGNPLTMRKHTLRGSAIGPYGFMGYQASGLGQLYVGHKDYGWAGEYKTKYPTYKDFYTAVATDMELAAEVCIKYGKGLYQKTKGDIGGMAALNLGGPEAYKAYKQGNFDYRLGKNMSIGTYISRVKRNLPTHYAPVA